MLITSFFRCKQCIDFYRIRVIHFLTSPVPLLFNSLSNLWLHTVQHYVSLKLISKWLLKQFLNSKYASFFHYKRHQLQIITKWIFKELPSTQFNVKRNTYSAIRVCVRNRSMPNIGGEENEHSACRFY